VRVTVVVVLATKANANVDPALVELAKQVQKRDDKLTGFKVHATEAKSIPVGESTVFELVDKQELKVTVTRQKDANGLKRLVAKLKTVAPQLTEEHIRVHRPWGSYQSVDNGDRHQVKRIIVKPGGRLSLQKHHHRSEHWIVVRGTARVTVNELVKTVHENESIYIPIGAVHRLENPGKILLELIEVQTGSYLGEDDIIRIEDDYQRS
jgi:mannose-6-phosphate isomerase-like protein (cupin superfamily)